MKNLLRSGFVAGALALSAAAPSAAVELQIGHTLTTDSHYQSAALKFKEIVESGGKGEITVNIFPQSQLGGEVKMIQSARTGAIAGFITAAPPVENTVQEYSILSLPYLFDNLDEANNVLQGPFGDKMLKLLESRGLVGLTFLSSFERSVFGSRAIRKVEDFKGMKIRVLQGPGFIRTYEAFGAQPTPMAYSEVFVALQNGVVDGAEADPAQVVQDKFVEVTKYFSFTKIHYMPSLLVLSKTRFDSLTKDQQDLVRRAAKEAAKASLEAYKKTYQEGVEGMKKAKVELIYPDLGPFKAIARAVWPSLLASVPNGDALLKDMQTTSKNP